MKKFISMVMAAAMVVSLVPATAFAATATATAKIENAVAVTAKEVVKDTTTITAAAGATELPELKLTVGDVNGRIGSLDTFEFEVKFTNVDNVVGTTPVIHAATTGTVKTGVTVGAALATGKTDVLKVTVTETAADIMPGDVIAVQLDGTFEKDSTGTKVVVDVTGDFGSFNDLVIAEIVEEGIKAKLDDECKDVAPEEVVAIDPIVIEPNVGDNFGEVLPDTTGNLTLKLNKGFVWANSAVTWTFEGPSGVATARGTTAVEVGDDEIVIPLTVANVWDPYNKITLSGMEVEAEKADAGEVANVTVKMFGLKSVKVAEVAKVIDYKVVMSLVDPDEDVPVFYNGVDVANTGLTVDDDHEALEVNIKETFEGAWSNHKEFTLSLPAGVHVANITDISGSLKGADVATELADAYVKGDHEEFVFAKRSFQETLPNTGDTLNEMEFVLVLVAEPDFVGDVVLKLEGAAMETQEVTIAKFVAPYTVKAEQNDVIIDYRYTEVPTDIVITEAEAGLWADGLKVGFEVEKGNYIEFEDDAVVTVNEESDMEIEDECVLTAAEATAADLTTRTFMGFEVTEESDEEPAVVTISGIELFMQRNIPAGPYALDVAYNTATVALLAQPLFAGDSDEGTVADVDDFSSTVHEAFINVITAGRDQDDASFTTKVVVPVGETTMYAGEKAITLDVPAYINANDYVMLPVRAVATALGINNDAVQWDQATKTVIIMYGQRIITMTAGQKVVYVSGTAIPAKAAVEIVDGRAFLGLRDLATTLGISAINYDATTKTATLN